MSLIRAEWVGGFVCFQFSIISLHYVLTDEIYWLFNSSTSEAAPTQIAAATVGPVKRSPQNI